MANRDKSFSGFIKDESFSGVVLLVATAIALIWANSGWADSYNQLWTKTYLSFSVGSFELSKPLYYWINDGLMAIFFFVIGLEIKRALLVPVIHEFHFFLIHRLIHTPLLYKYVHSVHHNCQKLP